MRARGVRELCSVTGRTGSGNVKSCRQQGSREWRQSSHFDALLPFNTVEIERGSRIDREWTLDLRGISERLNVEYCKACNQAVRGATRGNLVGWFRCGGGAPPWRASTALGT
eukprot:5570439-Pleurochrysis_carterae.AAC.1